MDLTQIFQTLTDKNTINAISEVIGADNDKTLAGIKEALPVLAKGLIANAADLAKQKSVESALIEHAKNDTGDVAQFIANTDQSDNEKIVGHILGDEGKDAAAKSIATKAGLTIGQALKMLSTLAPLIMSLIGQKTLEGDGVSGLAQSLSSVTGLLGGLLGDSQSSGNAENTLSGLIGGIGGLLGNKKK